GVKRNFELHLKECEWRYNKPLPQLIAEMKRLVAKNKDLMV
ncbi:IS1595 family transposase, partial [Nitratidesulfovibrio sp. 1201_IL3209]